MLTKETVQKYYHYSEDTGLFTFKTNRGGKNTGDIVNSLNNTGYIRITINNKRYLAHRIAWLYMTGRFPAIQIDHINGIRTDNRFCNLREATDQENKFNKPLMVTNKSRVKNVHWNNKNKNWNVTIMRDKKTRYYGCFDDLEDAKNCAINARKELHGEDYCNHGQHENKLEPLRVAYVEAGGELA